MMWQISASRSTHVHNASTDASRVLLGSRILHYEALLVLIARLLLGAALYMVKVLDWQVTCKSLVGQRALAAW